MANDGSEPKYQAGAEPRSETNGVKTDHHATYEGFMAMTKWGVIVVAVALILMAIFLA